jgi:glycosyltransferase involved in cell wall biosynthesis
MATEILPFIRRVFPDVRLRIIGRIRPEDASSLTAIDGVDVTGEVPSISDAARGGALGVCPLRLGAGIQNKILEYMALGLPVVSTRVGLEGLSAREGTEIVIADDPSLFADHVIQLWGDKNRAAVLAQAGRKYVEAHHSWPALMEPMLNVVASELNEI